MESSFCNASISLDSRRHASTGTVDTGCFKSRVTLSGGWPEASPWPDRELLGKTWKGFVSGQLLDREVPDRMKVLFPKEGHQVVLVIGEDRDAVETSKKRGKLLELETGTEGKETDAVAVEKKGEAVGSIGALEDDLAVALQLGLEDREPNLALFGNECAQPPVEIELEPLGDGVLGVVEALRLLRFHQKTKDFPYSAGLPVLRGGIGKIDLFRWQKTGLLSDPARGRAHPPTQSRVG